MDNFSTVINKVGSPVNGRQTYELKDKNSPQSMKVSVPVENADKFEKAMDEGRKSLQEMDNEENQAKLKELDKNFSKKMTIGTLVGTGIGAIVPAAIAIAVKGSVWKRSILGVLGSLAGAALGAWGSMLLAAKSGLNAISKNPMVEKVVQVSENLKSLDVRFESEEPVKPEEPAKTA